MEVPCLSLIGWNLGERLRVVLYSLALTESLRISAIKLRPHAGDVRLSPGATIKPNTAPATPTSRPMAEWPIWR